MNITYNGLLFSKNRIILTSNPKVSVVIPAYNKQNYIKQSIRSIQNQNMLDIDIVIVNDFSSDNTSKIIEELKKEDKRIRLINNKKNMGTLYTRCIGTLAAKGRYIFPLDADDMFLDKDIVNNVYYLAEKNNFDIIVFKAIMAHQFKDILKLENLIPLRKNIVKNNIYYQPEISKSPDIVLWDQCIKAEIYKKSIEIYEKKRYNFHLNYYEDAIINHIIYQLANSSASIQYYGIFYLFKLGTVSTNTTEFEKVISYMKYIEIMIEFSRNIIELKNKITIKIIYFINEGNFEKFINYTKLKLELRKLLKKIFNSKFLSYKNKIDIKNNISKVLFNYYDNRR